MPATSSGPPPWGALFPTALPQWPWTVTATIISSKSDPTPANNSATDETILSLEADLEVSKTDGVTAIIPGETLTYTITATNNGPLDDPSATLGDSFPTDLSCTYTSAANGGATGNTVAGSGNLFETLSMPAGSSVTYTVSCIVDPSATEKVLQNTATVATSRIDPKPANNSATDDDTVVGARQVDLEVTKSDDLVAVIPGQSLTYTIIATNKGPSDVPSATLNDSFPIDPHCNFYTSVASGGATGNTTAGLGDLGETLSMPAGSSVTYKVSCTVDTASSGTLPNTATIANSVTDPDPANNSATDINDVLAPSGSVQFIGPEESVVLDVADDSICEEIKPIQIAPSANGAVCINPAPTPSCSIDESTRTLNVDAGIGNLCVFVDTDRPVDFPDDGIRSATAIARLVNEFEIPERLTGSDPATVPVQISTVVSWDGLLWPVPTLLPVFSQVTGTLQVRDVTSGLVLASNTFLFERSGPTSIADTLVACTFGGCGLPPLVEFAVSLTNSTPVDLRTQLVRGVAMPSRSRRSVDTRGITPSVGPAPSQVRANLEALLESSVAAFSALRRTRFYPTLSPTLRRMPFGLSMAS